MLTNLETVLPLRALQAARRAFLAVLDDPTIAHVASNRPQLLHKMVTLAGDGGWRADPPQCKVGGVA